MPSDPSPRLPTPETIGRHLEAPSNRGLSIAEWDVLQAYAAGRLGQPPIHFGGRQRRDVGLSPAHSGGGPAVSETQQPVSDERARRLAEGYEALAAIQGPEGEPYGQIASMARELLHLREQKRQLLELPVTMGQLMSKGYPLIAYYPAGKVAAILDTPPGGTTDE